MNNPNNPQDIVICNPKRTPVGRYLSLIHI